MLTHFADPDGPGFFHTAADHEKLIARTKDLHDGSTPSGNAMAVTAFLRLARLCDRRDYMTKAEVALRGYQPVMEEHPAASGQMLVALVQHISYLVAGTTPGYISVTLRQFRRGKAVRV